MNVCEIWPFFIDPQASPASTRFDLLQGDVNTCVHSSLTTPPPLTFPPDVHHVFPLTLETQTVSKRYANTRCIISSGFH